MAQEGSEPIERWTAKRRSRWSSASWKGEISGRSSPDAWAHCGRGRGVATEVSPGAENALRSRPKDDEAFKDEQIKELKQKTGISCSTTTSYGRP